MDLSPAGCLRLLRAAAPEYGRKLNASAVARRLGVTPPTARAHIRAITRDGLLRIVPFLGGGHRPLLYPKTGVIGTTIGRLASCTFTWWKTGRVRRIDLIIQTPQGDRVGLCASSSQWARRRAWLPLTIALRRSVINRCLFVYGGDRAFVAARVVVLPAVDFLRGAEEWVLRPRSAREIREAITRINGFRHSQDEPLHPGTAWVDAAAA